MNLNRPPEKYDPEDQRQTRDTLSSADRDNLKKNVVFDKLVFRDTGDGSLQIVTVASGVLVVTAA